MSSDVNKIMERDVQINGLNVHYKSIGKGELVVIILHGWGIDSDRYTETLENLIQKASNDKLRMKVIVPDLPGFGKSDEPKDNWNLDDYVDFIDKFIEAATRGGGFELIKNILKNFSLNDRDAGILPVNKRATPPRKFILIGHSFGGRIAIKYATKYPEKIEKLILTGSAGIKHPLNSKQMILFAMAKIGKTLFSFPGIKKLDKYARIFLYKVAREKDYNSASPKMKVIMKNIIDEDLTRTLKNIKTPTLLVWGDMDRSTPISDARIMESEIEKCELKIVIGANHGLPYKKPDEFSSMVISAIKNEAPSAS